ncbi:MAG: SMC-Scp complex subunit ScpB [Ignavibacteriaceae bacterium]
MDKIYNNVVEALIFSSDEPIRQSEVIKAIRGIDGEEIEITESDVDSCINELNAIYESHNLSFRIKKVAEGLLFATKEDYSKYLGYLSSEKSKRRLSQASLETLSIIAYKQPLTKPELEAIRGVNSDYILTALLEKKLITISGRAETVGRPLLYSTTPDFLKYFGLYKISDLPKPREIEEIMQDEDFIEQRKKIMMNLFEEQMEEKLNESDGENSVNASPAE